MISQDQIKHATKLAKDYNLMKEVRRDGWTQYSIDVTALAELLAHIKDDPKILDPN